MPANYNTGHTGGLTRSMAHHNLPNSSEPAAAAPDYTAAARSLQQPPTPPSSAQLGVSPTASVRSGNSGNSGFVITSRRKDYMPPSSPNSQTISLAPTPSPPTPASTANLSHKSSLQSRRGSSPDGQTTSAANAVARKASHSSSTNSGRRASTSAAHFNNGSSVSTGPKTTLTLSSSIDSQGRRMVNQYVRLKTIGQGSHGKVWLCAEPSQRDSDLDDPTGDEESSTGGDHHHSNPTRAQDRSAEEDEAARARRKGKARQRRLAERWEAEIDSGEVRYCAIKSVAREGTGRGKSLRAARGRKASSQGGSAGIGQDDKIKREVAIMKRLDHPHIVRLKEVIDDPKSKKVFMVLEFMAGGQVVWQDENRHPTMTVDEARRTFRDVVLGLEYLHYQGIIHRDIKPANLLWTEDHSAVKISDFGVSHVSEALLRASPLDHSDCPKGDDDKALRKTAGSPAFFAPELCHPVESTPTPTTSTPDSSSAYFGPDAHVSSESLTLEPSAGPNGLPLSSTFISRPLPPADPSQPRPRAVIGQGIDVWALGVTLYCLLFGDTPFMANTEYELYNVIVRDAIRVPERMGKEQAWTGVPTTSEWDTKGDGEEGREVVDLLGRLLEKNPSRRISLEQVKKHPWVLRNLSSSPDSWLCETDPVKIETVQITEEDVECATRQRGAVDSLPPIRNRPGIRRALNAALVRFPAFARIKSQRRRGATNEDEDGSGRSRSKSASSTSQNDHEPTNVTLSRFPTDELASPSRKKSSLDFGESLRRIISGDGVLHGTHGGGSRSASPASTIGRGGWGNFQRRATSVVIDPSTSPNPASITSPTVSSPSSTAPSVTGGMPQLSRAVSASSVASRGIGHLLGGGQKKPAERSDSLSSGEGSTRGANTPSADGGTPVSSRRTISRVLSRLGGGERRGAGRQAASATASPNMERRPSASSEDHVTAAAEATANSRNVASTSPSLPAALDAAALIERFENEKFDSLGRAVRVHLAPPSQRKTLAREMTEDDGDDDLIDLTEFEYSESDDDDDDDDDDCDDDDFVASPIDQANGVSGWQSAFGNFSIGVEGDHGVLLADDVHEVDEKDFDVKPPSMTMTLEDSTPRQSARYALANQGGGQDRGTDDNGYDTASVIVPPPLIHRFSSSSPTRTLKLGTVPAFQYRQDGSNVSSTSPTSTTTSPRDGSIRGVSMEPPGSANSRRLDSFCDDEDDEDAGILIAPRRRRATTVSGGPA